MSARVGAEPDRFVLMARPLPGSGLRRGNASARQTPNRTDWPVIFRSQESYNKVEFTVHIYKIYHGPIGSLRRKWTDTVCLWFGSAALKLHREGGD